MADTYNITRHNQSLSSVFPQATVTTLHYNGRNIHGTMIFISIFFFLLFSKRKSPHESSRLSSRMDFGINSEFAEIYAHRFKIYFTGTYIV